MKKTSIFVTVLLLGVMLIALAACSPSGVYKLDSVVATLGLVSTTFKPGETGLGVTITEDHAVLDLKSDGTYTLNIDLGAVTANYEGTWKTNSEDSSKIDLYSGETVFMSATLKDGILTFSFGGLDFNLKKA